MIYRTWRQPKSKIYDIKNNNKVSKGKEKHRDEMKSVQNNEKKLKRKKKRLTIDWFFRPEGD